MTSIFMRRPHLHDIPVTEQLPDGYTLRQATSSEDDAALAALLTAAFDEPWDVARVQTRLTAAPDVRAVYIATYDGQIVATASHRRLPERFPDAGIVHWVGTHPDYRGRGLASVLLVRLLHDFAAHEYRAAALKTQDFRLPAIRAYLRLGFLPIEVWEGDDQRPVWSAIMAALEARERDTR